MKTSSRFILMLAILMPTFFLPLNLCQGIGRGEENKMEIFRFSLSEGEAPPPSVVTVPRVEGRPLSEAEVKALLDRLPPMDQDAAPKETFSLPVETLPAPRPGRTVDQPFPPPQVEGAPKPETGPLTVLRFSPQGDVPLAPKLSVTFSGPMVELTSHGDLEAKEIPVSLTPQPEGRWRWVGTKTLVFQPRYRFPMSTRYQVDVPAGTIGSSGGRLEKAVQWHFTTPPLRMDRTYPADSVQGLDPVIFIGFDQQIDPEKVIPRLKVTAGSQGVAVRKAGEAEIEADATVRRLVKKTRSGRWLAVRPKNPLPTATDITITVPADTPSAEGPLTTRKDQSFSFHTYDPFSFERASCGWGDECPPLTPWEIQFNNPIDESAFDPSMVTVSPELPDLGIEVHGDRLRISGLSSGQTTYKITLDGALQDIFGQTLEESKTAKIKVGSSSPLLLVPAGSYVVLDPSARPVHKIFTLNYEKLLVRIYAVDPEDYVDFQEIAPYRRSTDIKEKTIGRLVHEENIRIEGNRDEMVLTELDLSPWLENGLGHLLVKVEANLGVFQSLFGKRGFHDSEQTTWVAATKVGLDAFCDRESSSVWVNSLIDGSPLSGAEVRLFPGEAKGVTGTDGLVRLPRLRDKTSKRSIFIAQKGADKALLTYSTYPDYRSQGVEISHLLRWYVFDDRNMYRPGETVHFKGWIRRFDTGRLGEIDSPDENIKELDYTILESRGNKIADGKVKVNAFGGFDLSCTLPQNINLGRGILNLTAVNASAHTGERQFRHIFEVQEFRRPEFEVKTRAEEGPCFIGDQKQVTVSARYYAGGPLPSADVTWEVHTTPGHFTPPGWSEFTFGEQRSWMMDFRHPLPQYEQPHTYHGRTDTTGEHQLFIDFEEVNPPRPTVVDAQASVMDVNRQQWTASSSLLVHPAALYVGLKTERFFVQADEPYPVQAIVTDLDGQPVSGRDIVFKAVRRDWAYQNAKWKEVETDAGERILKSGPEPVRTVFNFSKGGSYRLTAQIKDDKDRINRTLIHPWVAGGTRPSAKNVEQETVTLIPDRSEYQPGDTAGILIQSPFQPAEGLLSYRSAGLVKTERFRMEGSSHTVHIPIEDAYIPNLQVQVDLVGAALRQGADGLPGKDLPQRPAFASGSINLRVPPLSRTLHLEVTPQKSKLEPGAETSVAVQVKNAEGRPVENSEIALFVVDESVLALSGYQLADPIGVFYQDRESGVLDSHSRENIKLVDYKDLITLSAARMVRSMDRSKMMDGGMVETEAMLAENMMMPMPAPMAAEAPGGGAKPIFVRKDFNPLAVFSPDLHTDEDGRARARFRLPDNLTRYRVMAVAVAGGKYFGLGESTITARLPLMVRPSPPRFLRVGDRMEFPVVLHNQTEDPLEVAVALTAINCRITGSAGFRVSVPPEDRVEVRFPMATESAGRALFQVGAASGAWADASQHTLPVYTPATTEAMAVYGEIDQGSIAQKVTPPQNAFTEFGGLDITTSSTALQALTDAVLYLVSYPYECSEQIASRILGVAALKDMLPAFNAEGMPSSEEIRKRVLKDIERLKNLQNGDGGFPIWERGRPSWPYHSVHVMHALARAKAAGFAVPEKAVNNGLEYIRRIERHFPENYSPPCRHSIQAYAVYVSFLLGDRVTDRARALIEEAGVDQLSLADMGWLLYAIGNDSEAAKETADLERLIGNRVEETASAAHFVTSYGEASYLLLHSNRRTDAIILEALIRVDPENSLIPKIVHGLMGHRKQGRWDNTQENAFILLALKSYFEAYEAQTPDFVARVWLGERFAGQTEFKGRSADYQRIRIPMSYLASQGPRDIILSKEGPGRLYYRLGLRYAPKDLAIKPADHGFAVERTYEAVDDPEDVRRDENGVWHVKAGTRIKVKLTMVAPSRRYHVALADPLPAGFEPLNPALAVTGRLPSEQSRPVPFWWWWSPWYEHQNMRDDRVEAFASLLWEDVYTYTYYARATTPGRFIAGPAKAEEMYSPETFGRAASEVVVVE